MPSGRKASLIHRLIRETVFLAALTVGPSHHGIAGPIQVPVIKYVPVKQTIYVMQVRFVGGRPVTVFIPRARTEYRVVTKTRTIRIQ